HGWPGNLRELRNAIERAAILTRGKRIEAEDLPRPAPAAVPGSPNGELPVIGGEHSLDEIEEIHLRRVLDWAPTLQDAAAILGIGKATPYRKRNRFGMD